MPNWTKEQSEAINKSGSNIIVSAGAGSGKTAVLTERVITKIRNGVCINELLILTFTNAAAQEMKDRIRNHLKKENLIEQLNYIDGAYITTFDSYALSIVKKYHYLLNIPSNVNIIDGTFINIQKEKILDNIFENFYKKRDNEFLKFINDFCIKDDVELKKCILTIYEKFSQKQDMKNYVSNYVNEYYSVSYIDDSFNKYILLLKNKIKSIKYLTDDFSTYVDGEIYSKLVDILLPLFNAMDYDQIKVCANISLPTIRNLSDDAKKIKSEISEILKEIKNLTLYTKEELINNYLNTKIYIDVILKIIELLDLEIKNYKKKINYYEFNDIALMAISILENNENIRLEIKNHYKEIMIDEYQDTNDLQEYFINLIKNNNVYMVGDIKQSIYRFRNANPDLFKTKYDNYSNFIDGFKIDLNKNFRSRKEILNDINTIFDLIMDNSIGGANYKESHRMIFGNQLYETNGNTQQNNKLELYNYCFDNKFGLTKEEIEAFIIASDIKKKVDNNYLIFDKDSSEIRPCTYKDFVVLMDRTTSFLTFKKVMDYHKIPCSILKDDNIVENTEMLLINNYIKLILKIKNKKFDIEFRYVLTSLLRSYLYQYSDNDIYTLFLNNDFYNTTLFKDAALIAKDSSQKSIEEILELIVDKTDFFNKIIFTNLIEDKINVIDYLRKLLKDLSLMGMSIEEVSNYLDEVIENLKEIKISKKSSNENAVKIMTIFKSKGLEFPICYMALMYKSFNIRELNSLFFYDNHFGIVPSLNNEGVTSTFIKPLAKNDYVKENISERLRLFYVALTRSKEKMIILTDLSKGTDEYIHDLVDDNVRLNYKCFNDVLCSVKNNLKDYITDINLNSLKLTKYYFSNDSENIMNVDNEEVINIKNIFIENKPIEEKHFSKEITKLISNDEYNNMEYGTFVHSVLENINFKNPNFDDLEISEPLKNNILNFLKSNLFKNIDSGKIYKEYEFFYEDEGTKYTGIIDLMIVYDNYVDIVDYKLKNIEDKAYIKQLNGYKKYISNFLKKDVNLYLYSIMENKLKKL